MRPIIGNLLKPVKLQQRRNTDGILPRHGRHLPDVVVLIAQFIPQSEISNPQSECRLFTSHRSNSMSRAKIRACHLAACTLGTNVNKSSKVSLHVPAFVAVNVIDLAHAKSQAATLIGLMNSSLSTTLMPMPSCK